MADKYCSILFLDVIYSYFFGERRISEHKMSYEIEMNLTFSAMPLLCSFRWFWRCSFKKPEDKIVNTPQLLRMT